MPVTAVPSIRIDRPKRTFSEQESTLPALKALLSIDFNQHDTRLKQCLEGAMTRAETLTGLLLTQAQITVAWSQLYDWEDLPHGPISGDVLITDLAGTTLAVTLEDTDFPRLYGNYPLGIRLAYTGGYSEETLPDDLLEAVLALAANNFDGGSRDWRSTVFGYHVGGWVS